jgi:hypothetical protein
MDLALSHQFHARYSIIRARGQGHLAYGYENACEQEGRKEAKCQHPDSSTDAQPRNKHGQ